MSTIFFRIQAFTALILLLAFLFISSGCTTKQQLSTSGLDLPPSNMQPEEADPDLDPVVLEPEISLDQELEALASTGAWEDPQAQAEVSQDSTEPEKVEPLYDFPVVVNRQVEMYLDLFQGKQRKYFGRWLARSGRYSDLILNELEASGIPKDLLYLAMIESGFNQRAYSKAKAVGLWQFMSGTGRDYGLSISRYVDERRDAEKSTKAAAAYLKCLYDEFGDWYLAVAAYNGGPGTLRKAIKKTKSRDFWKITSKIGDSSFGRLFRIMGLILSVPLALWGFRLLRSFSIPNELTWMFGIRGVGVSSWSGKGAPVSSWASWSFILQRDESLIGVFGLNID